LTTTKLLLLLSADLGGAVNDLDVKLVGALDDGHALEHGHGVGNLGAVRAVVHHQQVDVVDVAHAELHEAVRQHEARLLVRAIADRHERDLAAELTAHARINTLRAAPGRARDAHELIALVANERNRVNFYSCLVTFISKSSQVFLII